MLKAIEKEPRSRYSSADEFAEDLRRFLDDEPIRARRTPAVERVVRWSRRNKALSAALATVAGLLVLMLVGLSITSFRESRLRILAEDRSEALNRNLYFFQMNHAGTIASEQIGFAKLRDLTDAWYPKSGEPDLRGWEWYYLRSLLRGEEQAIRAHHGEVWEVQ